MRAVGILVDSTGKTIGVRINKNGTIRDIATDSLRGSNIKLDNAIVDCNGFVKAKRGNLPKILKILKPNTLQNKDMQQASKLISNKELVIYHGNKIKDLIPKFGVGGKANDYGSGFYTTPDINLAKEWAWGTYSSGNKAYVHKYKINIQELEILDLTKLDSIHWITELIYHRTLNLDNKEVVKDNILELIARYKLDTDPYDIIIGYRADDSYFAYAESFVNGTIYKDTLEKVLRTGELGLQVFIKSKKAFSMLEHISTEEVPEKFRTYFLNRDKSARDTYKRIKREQGTRSGRQTIYDFIK